MILGAIDVNEMQIIEAKMMENTNYFKSYVSSNYFNSWGNILLIISFIFSIILVVRYKKKLTVIINSIAVIALIVIFLMNNGSYKMFSDILYKNLLIENIIAVIIKVAVFIYTTIKFIKCIKSDKFWKKEEKGNE